LLLAERGRIIDWSPGCRWRACPTDYAPSTTIRTKIPGENAELRRSYVRMLVIDVSVNDNEIVIAGSTTVLEAAATKGI
jgi:hypothetical protein